jgi:hypothetical protein
VERFQKFVSLVDKAVIIFESDASWKTKYEMIFSPEISQAIYETNVDFNHYDPDMDYQDDVVAFVCAVRVKADELRPCLSSMKISI